MQDYYNKFQDDCKPFCEKYDIESKMVDTVELATALHDKVPMADADCKVKVIDDKNGTITIERSWENGEKSEYLHEGKIRKSETSFYRNALEKKDSITLGQNSNSIYGHEFSFQYRGLGFKRETFYGGENGEVVKLNNSAEGGFLNFNALLGYKRNTEGKMSTLSADASGSSAQFKDTASFIVKDKEYAKFSASVSLLNASASTKMDSGGIAKVSGLSHIVGGDASASVSGVTVANASGTLGEAKTSASNDFLDMKASASMGDYKTSVSSWNVLKTPKEEEMSNSDKNLITGNVSGSLENELILASEKFSTGNGEWKASNVVEQVKKDVSSLVEGLKSGHLNINTDTVKGIVKDVEAIHGIKEKGFGIDVSKKSEGITLGNSELMETGRNDSNVSDVLNYDVEKVEENNNNEYDLLDLEDSIEDGGEELENSETINVDDSTKKIVVIENSPLPKETVEAIREMKKGERPDPSTYMPQEMIDEHLDKFKEGGSFVMTQDQYDMFVDGKDAIGCPDNSQFMTTKENIDNIIFESGGNIGVFEDRLGFDRGHFFEGGGMVRIDVNNPLELNGRIPSGNEMGENDRFVPGGYTDGPNGGFPEIVTDKIPNDDIHRTITFGI